MKKVAIRNVVKSALVAAAVLVAAGVRAEGYVNLPSESEKVLKRCNPKNLPEVDRCRIDSLPGAAGYNLVASRSAPLVKNEIVVGTVYDRVWKSGQQYIFGMRVQLNADAYDLTGLSFNVNDLFRQLLEEQPAAVAYVMGPSTKALKKAGRTLQGLKEPDPQEEEEEGEEGEGGEEEEESNQPIRNNAWVDFRIDANAAEPNGPSSASSPWLLLKTKAPSGYSVKPFAIRALNSDFADTSEHVEVYLSGYAPN